MILVTGGTGLVGSHLLYELVSSGHQPIALKRPTSDINRTKKVFSYYSDKSEKLANEIKWVDGDILDYNSVADAMTGITYVYHCAASVSFQSSDKNTLIDTNVDGTTNIVNAALECNIKKLVHVSSIGALGRADTTGQVTENNHWNNKKTSVYSTSKYNSEMEVWRGIAEGLNAVIINPSIILGPGDWESGSSKLFTTMYKGLKFYTGGSNGFVDVMDVVDCMIFLANSDISGQRYIINSENINYRDFFYWMSDALGVNPPPYKAGKLLSEISWRALWLFGVFTGKKSTITKETAVTANQRFQYSNKKIVNEMGISFLPIRKSIVRNSKLFLQDNNYP